MRKGLAAIVAVVVLVAIAFIAAIALFYWAAGIATKQPVPTGPVPITAIPLKVHAGYLQTTIVNLGDRPLPEGDVFRIVENGAETEIIDPIPPNEQRVTWFWGRYDKYEGYKGFVDQATIYDPVSGSTAPSIAIPDVQRRGVIAYTTYPYYGFEPTLGLAQDRNGVIWLTFTGGRPPNMHDILIANSVNGTVWNTPIVVANQPAGNNTVGGSHEDSPAIAYNGTFYILYRSWPYYAVNESDSPRLRLTSSADGNTWSYPTQTNLIPIEANEAWDQWLYTSTNMRGFGFILDSNDMFWIAYINGTRAVVRNSTDGLYWNPEVTVDSTASPGRVSLAQGSGIYRIAYVGSNTTTVETSYSGNGVDWAPAIVVSDADFLPIKTGVALMQDQNANWFIFSDHESTDCGNCTDVFVQASVDGIHWSRSSWIPPETVSDTAPSAMQSTDGVYRLATSNSTAVRITSSTDPMIWVDT